MISSRRFWLVVVVLLMLGVFSFVGWWHSERDLRRMEAMAQERGVPITWSGIPIPVRTLEPQVADPASVVADQIMPVLQNWTGTGDLGRWWSGSTQWTSAARETVLSISDEQWSALTAACDAQDPSPLWWGKNPTGSDTPLRHFSTWNIFFALVHQMLILPPEEFPASLERIDRMLGQYPVVSQYSLFLHARSAEWVAQIVSRRARELRPWSAELARTLRRWADGFQEKHQQAVRRDMVMLLGFSRHPWRTCSEWGITLPQGLDEEPLMETAVRIARQELLQRQLDWISTVEQDPSLLSCLRAAQALPQPQVTLIPSAIGLIDQRLFGHPNSRANYIEMLLASSLRLRLVAADLCDEPWPEDPFAAGKPLTPILRGDRIIGAYSVWANGLDEGGKGDDRKWSLSEPFGDGSAGLSGEPRLPDDTPENDPMLQLYR